MSTLRSAGYRTAWLADNHGGPDAQERGHDVYAGIFNVNPDDLYGAHLVGCTNNAEMLPTTRDFALHGSGTTLMHAIGSHFACQAR